MSNGIGDILFGVFIGCMAGCLTCLTTIGPEAKKAKEERDACIAKYEPEAAASGTVAAPMAPKDSDAGIAAERAANCAMWQFELRIATADPQGEKFAELVKVRPEGCAPPAHLTAPAATTTTAAPLK